jgi:hypothetical protein
VAPSFTWRPLGPGRTALLLPLIRRPKREREETRHEKDTT